MQFDVLHVSDWWGCVDFRDGVIVYTLSAECAGRNQVFSLVFFGSLTFSSKIAHAVGASERAVFPAVQAYRVDCRMKMKPKSDLVKLTKTSSMPVDV